MSTRVSKIVLVAAPGLFLLLVVANNLLAYGDNLPFVQHVLSMDARWSTSQSWRALSAPWIHHAFYWTIIVWETVGCLLLFRAALKLHAARHASAAVFNAAKSSATIALTVVMLLWFVAFTTVGGEWFLMWQSKYNGLDTAFRLFASFALILIFLNQKDDELPTN